MTELDQKLNTHCGGKVVRKDLTSLVKGNASIPTYVLEYLLGQYCATNDEAVIAEGVEQVKRIISRHFVHRDEAQIIKSTVKERGAHKIIDKVSVRLNDDKDIYEASFDNLGLKKVPIPYEFIKQHNKLLSEGVWSLISLGYQPSEEPKVKPWVIERLKPIQISGIDPEEYKRMREHFSTEEWTDALLQSLGLQPDQFSRRSKLLQISRLVPFAENNFNLIELGPKGTGKSHVYSELSPHGILVSGGEVSKAKLFVNNSTGDLGLVGYWDVVAYDEFAGKTKKADRGLVDILKNYMANKSFSRGAQVHQAEASMVYVGNTDRSVPYMLQHSDLFESLPRDYYDSAFLDRIHCYLPGWEIDKLRNEMFTTGYGFIVDYLAEVLKELRKEDHNKSYTSYFELSETITTRDRTSIEKMFSGLVKVLYPHGKFSKEEARELLEFAIECRKRVKDQLIKMDETYDEDVYFQYTPAGETKWTAVETLELTEYGDKLRPGKSRRRKASPQPAGDKAQLQLPEEEEVLPPDGPEAAEEKAPQPGHKQLRENQAGISYKELFGKHLKGATKIRLADPYIRLPYQMRNLMEFLSMLIEIKEPGDEIEVHLVTNNNEEYLENAKDIFREIMESTGESGLQFTYEFDEHQHDRHISSDNGWKIILGRGLDIYQKTNGRYDIAEQVQQLRKCKACEITYFRVEG